MPNSTNGPTAPRMANNVYHPCVHLFTSYWTGSQVTTAAAAIKKLVLGSSDAPTFYEGPNGQAQLAVQTEFIPTEFSSHSKVADALALLDQRLDALFETGLAVHLLLPVHQLPVQGWQGVDWQGLAAAWPGSTFVPYQPSLTKLTNGTEGPYDVLAEYFHQPIIEHLVETGRAEKLAVIYLMNEFGYPSNTILDNASYWGNVPNWKAVRAEALRKTAARNLKSARKAAQGKVPVGIKFAQVTSPNTGWTPFPGDTDQLEKILNLMAKSKDLLSYDLYFNDSDLYDPANKERFDPFLPMFLNGYFEIAEMGRLCQGCPGEFSSGARTSATDITGSAEYWSEAKGLNLFAWNASGCDQGCFALADDNNTPYPGADKEVAGLMDLILTATGNDSC